MAYDSAVASFTTKTDKVDLVGAAHMNAVQSELVTIETILGTGVKGDRADLKTRLNNALDADGSILSGSAFPSPALPSQGFYRTDLNSFHIRDAANANWVSQTAALKLTSNTTVAAATNSGDISITNTKYYLVIINVTTNGSNNSISLRFNNDSTANKYGYINRGFDISATGSNANSNMAADAILMGPTMVNPAGGATYMSYQFYIFPQRGTSQLAIQGRAIGDFSATSILGYTDFAGVWNNAAAATSFRIFTTGGGTYSGNIYLYEVSIV